jgi:Mrp family chromosome partitioning ATPase
VYCISAWNPLGQQQQHSPSTNMARVQRADTNPGRGWLLGKATGLQLLKSWPQVQDKDWQKHIHRLGLQYGQQCTVPDVPRMLPASVHDTAGGAHIVAVATVSGGDGATEVEALLPANEQEGGSSSVPAAVAADAGVVDQQAANAPEVAWASATAAVADDGAKAGGGVPEAGQDQPKSALLGRDLSYLLAPGYKKWLHQVGC